MNNTAEKRPLEVHERVAIQKLFNSKSKAKIAIYVSVEL